MAAGRCREARHTRVRRGPRKGALRTGRSGGGRFICLSWGAVDEAGAFTMFRRAKLVLDSVPAED
ncbi:DUF5990 family protein [Streptomyces sp. NPDC058049]|uniref:DUF5990 family protein n=1 Tax=Streptomyces sp. NPDC058049 TaxID=3346314 RepID=UPI0036EE2CE3